MRRRLIALAILVILGFGVVAGVAWQLGSKAPTLPSNPTPTQSVESTCCFRFEEVAAMAGVHFRHEDGATAMQFLPEVMGGGVAWLDYDRDGYPDLFFVQSGPFPPDPSKPPTSRLYHNNRNGTFSDVTATAGIVTPGYGQGVTVGDYDNDGFPDLFVSHFNGGRLYHNEPADDGKSRRFRDVTVEAGLALDGWCTSCAFGDLHGNGFLDLFVCRYLVLDPNIYPNCTETGKTGPIRTACGPQHFPPTRSYLFRNNGDKTFTDVSTQAGLDADGKALGVVILDLDGDGKADIFVGNDEVLNHHYQNLGGGRFRSVALRAGTGATHRGRPMGSMGIEAGDLTGRGFPDLFVTTYFHESTVLFRNRGAGFFTDISTSAGMFAASWDKVGWGTALIDPDHDGNLDVFVANGHTHRNAVELVVAEDGRPQVFAQLPQLFKGNGKGEFQEVSATTGPYWKTPHVGRGVAMADYDNDGRADLVVTHVGGPPALMRNVTETPNHWVRVELEGARHRDPGGANRDAIGSVITVRVGGRTLVRHVKGGGSYYSAHEQRVLIGLGTAEAVDEVTVRWPNAAGTMQRFGPLAGAKSYRLIEGVVAPQLVHSPSAR